MICLPSHPSARRGQNKAGGHALFLALLLFFFLFGHDASHSRRRSRGGGHDDQLGKLPPFERCHPVIRTADLEQSCLRSSAGEDGSGIGLHRPCLLAVSVADHGFVEVVFLQQSDTNPHRSSSIVFHRFFFAEDKLQGQPARTDKTMPIPTVSHTHTHTHTPSLCVPNHPSRTDRRDRLWPDASVSAALADRFPALSRFLLVFSRPLDGKHILTVFFVSSFVFFVFLCRVVSLFD